uniref:Uncharacterized protein n=1 Tax=Arundo donax TaxID=35708 RepID=A0A0A9GIF3_ARUDO
MRRIVVLSLANSASFCTQICDHTSGHSRSSLVRAEESLAGRSLIVVLLIFTSLPPPKSGLPSHLAISSTQLCCDACLSSPPPTNSSVL